MYHVRSHSFKIYFLKSLFFCLRYSDNTKILAAKFKERPLSPMNTAIYWTEYVLKFKGAPHLRPSSKKLYWFSESLLDVHIFITVV
mgnify:FL=1